jgi:glycosyltransferase involved in cell wall biosynthesis
MSEVNTPYFSIIIPLYNKESEIINTINSVLNQTFSDFELIVVNDGSTDNSLRVIDTIRDPRLTIITKKNGGVSSARNLGILNSSGNNIALLDGDDLWLPDYLQEIKQLIDKFPDCRIFCTDYIVSSAKFKNQNQQPAKHSCENNYFKLAMYVPFLTASSIVIKRDCFNKEMFFNESLSHGEDLDLWIRLINKYPDIGSSSRQLVYYNHSANSRASRRIPQLQNHFVNFVQLDLIANKTEKKYYINQISFLCWLYIKNLKVKYISSIFRHNRKYIFSIVLKMFSNIVFNPYKKLIKNK